MYLFLAVFFPLSLFIFFLKKKEAFHKTAVAFALILGSVTTITLFIFTFPARTFSASVFLLSLYYAASEIFFPFVLPFSLYAFFMSRKKAFKMQTFFPFTAAFYSVYFPYISVMNHAKPFFFDLFLKPPLYLLFLIFIHFVLKYIDKVKKATNFEKIILALTLASFPLTPAFYHAGIYIFSMLIFILQILLMILMGRRLCKTNYY